MSLSVGVRRGIYEVLAKLGEGGMGHRHLTLEIHTTVALEKCP